MDSFASVTVTEASAMTAMPSASGTMALGATGMPNMPSNASTSASMSGMEGMDMSCRISMLWNWFTIDACFLSSTWHIRSRGAFAGSCIGVICLVLSLEFLRRVGREYDAFILRRARQRQMSIKGPFEGSRSASNVKDGLRLSESHPECSCNCPPSSSAGPDGLVTMTPSVESSTTKLAAPGAITAITSGGLHSVKGGELTSRENLETLPPYRPSLVEQVIRALLHMVQFAVAYIIMLLAMYFNGYIIICIFIGAFLGSLIFSWEPLSLSHENDATQVTKCCG